MGQMWVRESRNEKISVDFTLIFRIFLKDWSGKRNINY